MNLFLNINDNTIKTRYCIKKNNINLKQGIVKDGVIMQDKVFFNIIKSFLKKEFNSYNKKINLNLSFLTSKYNIEIIDINSELKNKEIKKIIDKNYSLKDYFYSYYKFKDKTQKKLLYITIPKVIIKNYVKILNKCNLKIKLFEHDLFKILKKHLKERKNIIYINDFNTLIMIFNKDLNFFRKIKVGSKDLKNKIDREKLVAKIYRSLDYYQIEYKVELEKITLYNVYNKKIINDLNKRLGLKISTKEIL